MGLIQCYEHFPPFSKIKYVAKLPINILMLIIKESFIVILSNKAGVHIKTNTIKRIMIDLNGTFFIAKITI